MFLTLDRLIACSLFSLAKLCGRLARFVGNVRLKITLVRSSGDTNEGDQTQFAIASVAQQPAATPVDCLALYAMARRMRPKQTALSIR